ncbi:MAG: proprotein convertase P-domain-containing protein [Acidobacteriota bacterium]
MRRGLVVFAVILLAVSTGATSQFDRGALQNTNQQKGADEEFSQHRSPDVAIPDDAYDGTIGSMVCLDVAGVDTTITDLNVEVGITHTWVGDLVIKLVSPSAEVLTLMSRPGFDEGVDDGSGCCGTSSNIDFSAPVTFDDAAAVSAEDMGLPGSIVCLEDGICDYFPFPDAGPGTNLAQFNGQNGAGTWQVCVGDAAGGDTGDLETASIVFNQQEGDLAIIKTAPNGVAVGGPYPYRIEVTNNGPADQPSVMVTDVLPAEISYVSDSCGGGAAGQDWTWSAGTVAVGATVICDLTVQLVGPDCVSVNNTATVVGGISDPNGTNNSSSHSNGGGEAVADPSFELGTPNAAWNESSTNFGTTLCDLGSCGNGTGTGPRTGDWWSWFGGIGTYEEGSVSQDLTISTGADLSFYLEMIICDSGADYLEVTVDGNQIWVIDGSSALCGVLGYSLQTVDLAPYDDGAVHTLAFHSEIFANNGAGSNFFVDDVSIPGTADCTQAAVFDLALTKSATNNGDGTGTYGFTVQNLGPDDATGIVVTDILPAGVAYVSDTCGGSEVGGVWTWPVGNLLNGASATCDMLVTVIDPADTFNNATVAGAGADTNPGNDSDSAGIPEQMPEAIPTIGFVGMMVLLLLVASAGFFLIRRRV